jgi:eukaryotic-like serine/threonine-protein kinase
VHDLEEVLAIEAARSGETTGEATTVLRNLPGDTADFAPQRLRHPKRTLFLSVLLLVLVGGAIAYFATSRTEKGAGSSVAPRTPGLSQVHLAGNAASDYDPEGDGEESQGQAQLAIDGNRTTAWDTETYQGGLEGSNKRGVGLYLDTETEVAARQLGVVTATPGFTASVYAANTVPGGIGGWTKVSPTTTVKQDQKFPLDTARRRFRYYLVWITELPEGGQADIRELSLEK